MGLVRSSWTGGWARRACSCSTSDDGPRDHFQAGAAAQRVWLEATRLGLVGSLTTQPSRLPAIRSGICAATGLSGMSQLLVRLEYPRGLPDPPSARRPLPEVFAH